MATLEHSAHTTSTAVQLAISIRWIRYSVVVFPPPQIIHDNSRAGVKGWHTLTHSYRHTHTHTHFPGFKSLDWVSLEYFHVSVSGVDQTEQSTRGRWRGEGRKERDGGGRTGEPRDGESACVESGSLSGTE